MSPASRPSVTSRSAERIADVLLLLAKHERAVSTATIAAGCNIPKSTTHQLLNTLLSRGLVEYHPDEHTWSLGVLVFELGSAYMRGRPIQQLGRRVLVEISELTGSAAHLAVLDGTEVLYIDKEQPVGTGAPHLVTTIGVRLPAHLTAVGRSVMAALPPEQVEHLYREASFIQRTGIGPRSTQDLLEDLAVVRNAGFAIECGLTTSGISCIAAAVYDQSNQPVGAVGITFVTDQKSDTEVDDCVQVVRDAAARFSVSLGWRDGKAGGSRDA